MASTAALLVTDSWFCYTCAFRRRYGAALPAGYKPRNAPAHGQGMGVTHICLGVPLGYGVSFAGRRFEQQAAPRKQHETEFKRILKVEKSWKNWRQKGKQLSAEELHVHLGMPSL